MRSFFMYSKPIFRGALFFSFYHSDVGHIMCKVAKKQKENNNNNAQLSIFLLLP